jgi:hypothetical protein
VKPQTDNMAGQYPAGLPLLLTPRALARLLHTSVRTLERRRRDGDFIPYRRVGRRILYSAADVLAHLDEVKVG